MVANKDLRNLAIGGAVGAGAYFFLTRSPELGVVKDAIENVEYLKQNKDSVTDAELRQEEDFWMARNDSAIAQLQENDCVVPITRPEIEEEKATATQYEATLIEKHTAVGLYSALANCKGTSLSQIMDVVETAIEQGPKMFYAAVILAFILAFRGPINDLYQVVRDLFDDGDGGGGDGGGSVPDTDPEPTEGDPDAGEQGDYQTTEMSLREAADILGLSTATALALAKMAGISPDEGLVITGDLVSLALSYRNDATEFVQSNEAVYIAAVALVIIVLAVIWAIAVLEPTPFGEVAAAGITSTAAGVLPFALPTINQLVYIGQRVSL